MGKESAARLDPGGLNALDLEHAQETLHGRFVETAPLPAGRGRHARHHKSLAAFVPRALNPAMRLPDVRRRLGCIVAMESCCEAHRWGQGFLSGGTVVFGGASIGSLGLSPRAWRNLLRSSA